MTEQEVLEGIREVLGDALQLNVSVTPSTNLVGDLELDSLKQLTLVVELENRFRVRLDAREEERLETVEDLVRVIRYRLTEKPQDA